MGRDSTFGDYSISIWVFYCTQQANGTVFFLSLLRVIFCRIFLIFGDFALEMMMIFFPFWKSFVQNVFFFAENDADGCTDGIMLSLRENFFYVVVYFSAETVEFEKINGS